MAHQISAEVGLPIDKLQGLERYDIGTLSALQAMVKQTGLAQPGGINSVPKGVYATKDVCAKSEKSNDYCLWRASQKGKQKIHL